MGRSKTRKDARSGKARARAKRIKSYRRAVNRASYNTVLYEARTRSGLSRFRFACALKIFPFLYYRLIESGYLKPLKHTREKISAYLGEDYVPYCEGISSYPEDLPGKKRLKITVWAFNVLGSLPFRIFLGLLVLGMLACLAYGYREYNHYNNNAMAEAPEDLLKLMNGIREQGSFTLSPGGTISRMEIYRMEGDKLVTVKVDTDDSFPYNVDLTIHHWLEHGRISYSVSMDEQDPGTVSAGYSDYDTNQTYEGLIDVRGETPVLERLYSKISSVEDPALKEQLSAVMLSEIGSYHSDIEDLIFSELGLKVDLEQLRTDSVAAYSSYQSGFILSIVFLVLGGCLALLFLFCLIYCLIYGTKKGVGRQVMTNNNLVRYAMRAEPKTDLRFAPFLPETLLSIVGSTILFNSSLRLLSYAAVFVGIGDMDLSTAGVLNTQLMNFFYLGMFLLYFLDFDTFLDDMRVMGRIFLYLFLYLGLYALEYGIMSYLESSGSPLYNFAASFTPPNMFGTITQYFVIMLFLFFTPRFVTTRKRLVAYRLCSLIPVLIIFGTHVISKGAKTLFDWDLPLSLRLLLSEEKIAFSVLCVSYLFMTFFLRLFFEHRYGTDNARKIFNGNRFIWIKNSLTCLLIAVIVGVNQLLGNNSQAVDFGWGQTTDLLLLTPLILFYHPHKGPRSRFVDALTMTYYLIALTAGYFLAVIVIVLGGLL